MPSRHLFLSRRRGSVALPVAFKIAPCKAVGVAFIAAAEVAVAIVTRIATIVFRLTLGDITSKIVMYNLKLCKVAEWCFLHVFY